MSDIEIRPMRLGDEEKAREMVCVEYMAREPLERNLGAVPERDGNTWFDTVFPDCLTDGLSVVAVDRTSGDLAGVRFTGVAYKDKPDHFNFSKTDPNTRALALTYEAIDCLYNSVNIFSKYGVDKYVSFRGICVPRKYSRQGIATKLVELSLELSRRKNFKVVTAEASSRFSSRVFEKCGFERLVELPYESMVLDGQPLEKTDDLKYHEHFCLYVKTL